MKHEINFRIILQKPPAEVIYGLQMGHGNNYQIAQPQRSTGEDLIFEFSIHTKSGKDSSIDFSGLFVQGSRGGRFIYINIGSYAGQVNADWNRRLKIPLIGITQSQIDEILESQSLFETSVPGTGKDGGPNCATVKPFVGWSMINSK